MHLFAEKMADSFLLNAVGTKYSFLSQFRQGNH